MCTLFVDFLITFFDRGYFENDSYLNFSIFISTIDDEYITKRLCATSV